MKTSKSINVALAMFGVVAAVIVFLVGTPTPEAQAQFKIPKIPGNIPNIPIPGGPGGSGARSGNINDLKDLAELGKKWSALNDLDNPQRQEEIGQAIALAISNKYVVSKNRSLNEYINLVGLTVASMRPRTELRFTFGVLETAQVSAYSTPGGYIFITQGALRLIEDEAELAGVLAHEVAHVVKNHGIEAMKSAKFKELSADFVSKYGQKWAAYNQQIDSGLNSVLVEGYNKNQERDADADAVKYLVLAGYDPRGYPRFLERMEQNLRKPGVRQDAMKTHPGTAERISNTTRQISQLKTIGGATLKDRYEENVKLK